MSGLGAWSFGPYKAGLDYEGNERLRAGLRAIKAEVVYLNPEKGAHIDIDAPIYGAAITKRVKELQAGWDQTVTGHFGVYMAFNTFWTRCVRADLARHVPGRLTYRLIRLESNHDPVAQGFVDERDEGGAQIHRPFHPEITLAQCWDPAFYIPWLSENLSEAAVSTGDFDGAVAAHNVGTETARQWVAAGKPASGNVHDGIDWFARATNYVRLVKGQRTPA